MIQASSVTWPSRSGLAPRPTQQLTEDSVTLTPASTASRAEPLRPSTSQAPLFAARPVSQVEMTTGPPGAGPGEAPTGSLAGTFLPRYKLIELKNEVFKKPRRLD